jgi:hypothetical protein
MTSKRANSTKNSHSGRKNVEPCFLRHWFVLQARLSNFSSQPKLAERIFSQAINYFLICNRKIIHEQIMADLLVEAVQVAQTQVHLLLLDN